MSTPLAGTSLCVGDVLAGKYRLDALVGEGGTGIVVRATHLALERPVAIKFLRTALASDEIRLRFAREARAIENIDSDHVVVVLDVGTLDDGMPYMVMEFLDGRDLARVLREDGPLPVEEAVGCMLQVCEALHAAHRVGIVHRDLKPANLFLTRAKDGAPHVKVVDFGISKMSDPRLLADGRDSAPSFNEVTAANDVLGSPRYMAPEQLRASKFVDVRADLWSVGAVLFQLLTGKHAFDAESNVAATVKVLTSDPVRVRMLAPHVPAELEEIVERCLTKDPEARWQTAHELAEALRPFAPSDVLSSLDRLRAARAATTVDLVDLGLAPKTYRPGGGAPVPLPPATVRMATSTPLATPSPVTSPIVVPPATSTATSRLQVVAIVATVAAVLALGAFAAARSAASSAAPRRDTPLEAGAVHP